MEPLSLWMPKGGAFCSPSTKATSPLGIPEGHMALSWKWVPFLEPTQLWPLQKWCLLPAGMLRGKADVLPFPKLD